MNLSKIRLSSNMLSKRSQDASQLVRSHLGSVLERLGPPLGAATNALGMLLERPRGLKRRPRAPQEPQDASKTLQDFSETTRKPPRGTQDASKTPPR